MILTSDFLLMTTQSDQRRHCIYWPVLITELVKLPLLTHCSGHTDVTVHNVVSYLVAAVWT